jgi:hypothetical protein
VPEFLADAESPLVARIRAKYQTSPEAVEAYLQRGKTMPVWLWAVLGGGCLLAIVLLIIILVAS